MAEQAVAATAARSGPRFLWCRCKGRPFSRHLPIRLPQRHIHNFATSSRMARPISRRHVHVYNAVAKRLAELRCRPPGSSVSCAKWRRTIVNSIVNVLQC